MTKPRLPLYHTTSYANMARIAKDGLNPSTGGSLFSHGAYGNWARGKVFLAEGRQAALGWFGKVEEMLAYRSGDDADAAEVVPVLLLVEGPRGLHVDTVGQNDVLGDGESGSWYTEKPIPPSKLFWWDPVEREWNGPVMHWDDPGAELGVSEVEFFDEEGDPTDDEDLAVGTGITVFGPYDEGGFKPPHDDDEAWDEEEE